MSVLEVRDLGIRTADGRELVAGLSFELGPAERLGLVGESGSGKTLTALALIGLLPRGMRASGSVLLDGQEVVGAGPHRLDALRGRAVAMVFQDPLAALDPLKRAGAQVAEPLRRHRGLRGAALRAEVLDLLERVRLAAPERISLAYPHELSGGQRQRVAIAMALACRPELLIADEPTTALDTTVQAEVLALLDGLAAAEKTSLLYIGHDLAVVSAVAGRLLVMHGGRAVESGTSREIMLAPRHPRTRELVAAARRLHSSLDGIVS